MFTGIIAERGTVAAVSRQEGSAVLTLDVPSIADDLGLGGSIAVNGVCLTAITRDGGRIDVDVMGETLDRTTVGSLQPGDKVNLERCVPAGGRLDGHVVQGHIDGVGALLERENQGNWDRLRFSIPQPLARYVAEKGSIAIDGVSLTVTAVSPADAQDAWFEVGLIPITLAETGLGAKQPGEGVNLEVDVLAKYAERLMAFIARPAVAGSTEGSAE
ncbi:MULTISPECIES: riboflavin synthase [Arthrobacter]|uniref:Riboflavin synthase n=2 Tax=Arthrobacter TaxID=1663 RepID=A0ABU9KIB6_9MICC|nr:riboflavin synthase [Arthrobacter sp. YJM1]MDP5225901.1 riboflavin synthase [Arthrobacter sp. YJM1]